MQVKIVIILHVYLFVRQLINIRSIVLTVFLKKLKSSIKIAFCIESKVEFLVELEARQFKKLIYISTKAKHGDSSKLMRIPLGWWLEVELKFFASFSAGGIWV